MSQPQWRRCRFGFGDCSMQTKGAAAESLGCNMYSGGALKDRHLLPVAKIQTLKSRIGWRLSTMAYSRELPFSLPREEKKLANPKPSQEQLPGSLKPVEQVGTGKGRASFNLSAHCPADNPPSARQDFRSSDLLVLIAIYFELRCWISAASSRFLDVQVTMLLRGAIEPNPRNKWSPGNRLPDSVPFSFLARGASGKDLCKGPLHPPCRGVPARKRAHARTALCQVDGQTLEDRKGQQLFVQCWRNLSSLQDPLDRHRVGCWSLCHHDILLV